MEVRIHKPNLDGTIDVEFIDIPVPSSASSYPDCKTKEIITIRFDDENDLLNLRNQVNVHLGLEISISPAHHQEIKDALQTAINKCTNADQKILTQEIEIVSLNKQIESLQRQIEAVRMILKTITENLLFTVKPNLPNG